MRNFNTLLLITALVFLSASFANAHQERVYFRALSPSENTSFGLLQENERSFPVRSFAYNDAEQKDVRTNTALPYFEDFETANQQRNSLHHFGFTTAGTTEIIHRVGALIYNNVPIAGALGSRSYIFVIPNRTQEGTPNLTIAPDLWIITAGFELQAGVEYSFEMYVFAPGYISGRDGFRIAVGNSASIAGLNTILLDRTGANAQYFPEWTRVRAFFTPAASGTFYFGINVHTPTPGGHNALGFDNIAVYEVSTPEVKARLHIPEFNYTIAPSFLAAPSRTAANLVSVENRGRNDLTNIQADITVQKNGSAHFASAASHLGALAFDANAAALTGAAPFTLDSPVSSTPDIYNFSAVITSPEGLNQTVVRNVHSPHLSADILARDNGIFDGAFWGNPGVSTMFGTTFFLNRPAGLDAVIFRLAYEDSRHLSHIRVLRLNPDTNEATLVGASNPFHLDADRPGGEYEIPLIDAAGNPLVVDAGIYFVMIHQPHTVTHGRGLAIRSTTTQSSYMAGIVWVYGRNIEPWEAVPYIRLRVSEAPPNNLPETNAGRTQVISHGNVFELNYTADFTSVAVFNISGQMVYSSALPPSNGTHEISTDNLPRGVYIVQFAGKTVESAKVVR